MNCIIVRINYKISSSITTLTKPLIALEDVAVVFVPVVLILIVPFEINTSVIAEIASPKDVISIVPFSIETYPQVTSSVLSDLNPSPVEDISILPSLTIK